MANCFSESFFSCLSARASNANEEVYTLWLYRKSSQYVLASNCRGLG
jgi:hypothetical protein